MTDPRLQPTDRRKRGVVAAILGVLGVVLLYIWDDALFAAPIIALVGWKGPVVAFLIAAPVLGTANFVGGLLAVRAYDHMSDGEPSRLEAWLTKQAASKRGQRAERLILSGKALGFVASSFLLGGVVTTWIARYSGRREQIRMVAFASSTIFAVTFVGAYTGIGKLIVDRFN